MTGRKVDERLEPNRQKLLEVILYLIAQAEELKGPALTQYQIVKAIFLADKAHLNGYGRPITYDNYSAMKFGPVPSEAYDMLKADYRWSTRLNLPGAPWEREKVTESAYRYCKPARAPNLRLLSKSDLRALDDGLDFVRKSSFGEIVDTTHEHPAYVDAWNRRGANRAAAMSYVQLLDTPDEELVHDLVFASRRA